MVFNFPYVFKMKILGHYRRVDFDSGEIGFNRGVFSRSLKMLIVLEHDMGYVFIRQYLVDVGCIGVIFRHKTSN